ncbi:hypothetical protein [Seohaeicola zhoushanensis]|uniref:Uncharacterized protein n=1 Tax=Seohaeicola zhoushanensis TaxID=1569283 RepID=A0A8J3H3R6_9RHOB|nr:hypothetical protein [Seohaeicola zhoushanensis]GHF75123.1 hypothetical protein GCM10017056_52070 [Seohaeicola zhoushanensis]
MNLPDLLADPFRVLQQTDAVLEIEYRPIRRAAIAVGAILLAAAMGLAALADGAIGTGITVLAMTALIGGLILRETAVVTQLRLDRAAGHAQLRVTRLQGRENRTVPLAPSLRVEPRIGYGSSAGTDRAELVLVTANDSSRLKIQIPTGRADREDVARMAAEITSWLSRTSEDRP